MYILYFFTHKGFGLSSKSKPQTTIENFARAPRDEKRFSSRGPVPVNSCSTPKTVPGCKKSRKLKKLL